MLDLRSFLEHSVITGKQMPAQHSQAVNSIKDCVTEKLTEQKQQQCGASFMLNQICCCNYSSDNKTVPTSL